MPVKCRVVNGMSCPVLPCKLPLLFFSVLGGNRELLLGQCAALLNVFARLVGKEG